MAFLEVRLTLGKCQPTSVAFPASKNRKKIHEGIRSNRTTLRRSRDILDFKQGENYPIWGKVIVCQWINVRLWTPYFTVPMNLMLVELEQLSSLPTIHMKMNMEWVRESWKLLLSTPVDSGAFIGAERQGLTTLWDVVSRNNVCCIYNAKNCEISIVKNILVLFPVLRMRPMLWLPKITALVVFEQTCSTPGCSVLKSGRVSTCSGTSGRQLSTCKASRWSGGPMCGFIVIPFSKNLIKRSYLLLWMETHTLKYRAQFVSSVMKVRDLSASLSLSLIHVSSQSFTEM